MRPGVGANIGALLAPEWAQGYFTTSGWCRRATIITRSTGMPATVVATRTGWPPDSCSGGLAHHPDQRPGGPGLGVGG
jgi:hypothetical protein